MFQFCEQVDTTNRLYELLMLRYLVEKLLRSFQTAYTEDKGTKDAVDKLATKEARLMAQDLDKMTQLCTLLSSPTVKNALWAYLKLDSSVPFPELDHNNVIYGNLSDSIHFPEVRVLYLSDKVSSDEKLFFEALTKHFKTQMVEISAEEAAAGAPLNP